MNPRHRLLARQLRKHFPDGVPSTPGMTAFLGAIESAYEQQDADRVLLDRAMKLSSDELSAAVEDLRRQNALEHEVLGKLRASVAALRSDESAAPFPAEDLLQLAAAIEVLVAGRNAAKQALVTAKEAAESANRAKSEFLAVMSHEIRTPLNAVIGFSSIMAESPRADHTENIAIIRESAEHLLALINDILDFSKIEAGRLELEFRPLDLARLIGSAVDFVRPEADRKQLALVALDLSQLPGCVLGDAGRLRQVLVNLLSNAVKFTARGSVTLTARARRHDDAWQLAIEVADTGPGIPENSLGRLFQAFSQVDSSNIRQHGGTGLGLAISRRLAELMGGTLDVRSNFGAGSTFTFRVPLRPHEKPAAPSPGPSAAAPLARPLRLLIAEDNENNRRLMRVLLETDGYPCTFAHDGNAALRALARPEDFDVVFLDLQMPEVDGFTVAAELRRAVPADRPPYVIALSAAVRPEDRTGALAVGMHEFVGKPAAVTQIREALGRAREWIARHGG